MCVACIARLLDCTALQSPAWVQGTVLIFSLPHLSQGTSCGFPFILGRQHLDRVAILGPSGSYSRGCHLHPLITRPGSQDGEEASWWYLHSSHPRPFKKGKKGKK